ncbi:MAG: SIS domain-containing protein [Thermomicrobium sp.]|nr:SIS domain-containing protein [Thermomicrobium sp.]MDW8060226.1 SIS domain-containing protein [Thermomicrobium sp.]
MSILEHEILEQPVVLERLLNEGTALVQELAARIRAAAPRFVVIAARGSSDNAARYAQYLFGAYNRFTVALATPSLFTLYQRPPSLAGGLVVAVSQSGRSPDIVAVVAEGRRQGALTLAVTNDPASPLAEAAELVLPLSAGEERAVAATKTYTAQLFALAMLSVALADDRARAAELALVPAAVHWTIERNRDLASRLGLFRTPSLLAVIGRGFNYATAFEIALKIKEVGLVLAEPYSSADFRHGPIALVEPGFPVVALAPSGAVLPDVAALVVELAERRASLAVVSDEPALLARADLPLPLPPGLPEWLSPLVAVVPGQFLALALARARGLDPDRPRGLAKVTRTY